MAVSASIPNQVKLPFAVALRVVLQGIRIRLGRSLVTLSGVVLGVAFLTSIVGAQVLRRSVAAEDRLRAEVNRAYGALLAETGPLTGKKVALVFCAQPSTFERRLLERVVRDNPAELRGYGNLPAGALSELKLSPVRTANELGADVSALLVIGDGALTSLDFAAALRDARQKVVAVANERVLGLGGFTPVVLARRAPPDEQVRLASAERRESVRGLWIIVISLLVTVIGITNAMLMSVTERFRDIGTMKCLGAEPGFIRRIFLIEAGLVGLVGGALGVLLGDVFAWLLTLAVYGPALALRAGAEQFGTLVVGGIGALSLGVVLSLISSLYPAQFAARMLPAVALRSNV